jgi:glycosyltransferase involved in cell wall biosynthesis
MLQINLLFIVPSLRFGGAEKQAVAITNGLSQERYNIHFFTFEKELNQLKDLNSEKVKFYNQAREHKFDITPSKRIAEIIDKEKINVIYSSLRIAFIYALLGRIIAKKKPKLVACLHTTVNMDLKDEFFDRFLYASLLRKCDRIVTVCDIQKKYLANKYPFLRDKFITIHNGIDTEEFKDDISDIEKIKLRESLSIQNDELIIGMVAGLRPEKGHQYALEALRIVLEAGIKLKLILVGDGKRRKYLESLAKRLGISQNIIWLGFQKEPKIYLSIFDIFLLTSFRVETFPVAILEALSMNKPVITTNIGGTSEVIIDGVTGYLIKPKSPTEIAEKIKYLAENREILERLSKNTRQSIVDNFSLSQTIKKTEMLFKELV